MRTRQPRPKSPDVIRYASIDWGLRDDGVVLVRVVLKNGGGFCAPVSKFSVGGGRQIFENLGNCGGQIVTKPSELRDLIQKIRQKINHECQKFAGLQYPG